MTALEQAAATEEKIFELRRQRKYALMDCDWTQLPDVPSLTNEKKAEWNSYRQALRDVSLQEGFPWDVVWPTPPT